MNRRTVWSKNIALALGVLLTMTFAQGCGTPAPPSNGLASDAGKDPPCRYTAASDKHVQPRHCDPVQFPDKSKFNAATPACSDIKGGQIFCSTVQQDPNQRRVQPDGRIRYDKNFGQVIGTQGTQSQAWGRVVIDSTTGEVVTQFPESSAADSTVAEPE